MAEALTRRMIRESHTELDNGKYTWIARTEELALQLYPEDEQKTTGVALFVMDSIMEMSLERYQGWRVSGYEFVPDELAEDQVEDWIAGRAVHQVLVSQRLAGPLKTVEVLHG